MVKITKAFPCTDKTKFQIRGTCESTDVKPINGIADNSFLFEIDTKGRYFFNEKRKEWVGGAGSSGSSPGGYDMSVYVKETDSLVLNGGDAK